MSQYIHILESTGTICLKTIETDGLTPTREAVITLLNQQASKMADDTYRIKVTSSPKCTDPDTGIMLDLHIANGGVEIIREAFQRIFQSN